jgi:hypothetical protein
MGKKKRKAKAKVKAKTSLVRRSRDNAVDIYKLGNGRGRMNDVWVLEGMSVVVHIYILARLTPCNFFLFPKMKMKLKGRRFDTVEEIQAETQTVRNTPTKKNFQDAFQKWQIGVCAPRGDYFEDDGAELLDSTTIGPPCIYIYSVYTHIWEPGPPGCGVSQI